MSFMLLMHSKSLRKSLWLLFHGLFLSIEMSILNEWSNAFEIMANILIIDNWLLVSYMIPCHRIIMQKISNSEFHSYRGLIQKMKYYMFSRENFSFLSFVYTQDFSWVMLSNFHFDFKPCFPSSLMIIKRARLEY